MDAEIVEDGNGAILSTNLMEMNYACKDVVDSITMPLHEDFILEIDWQGASQVRRVMKETIGVFILPPSIDVLRERLNNRGQDAADVIARRVAEAQEEMSHYVEADYLVVNDNFDIALDDLKSIVNGNRLKLEKQRVSKASLLENLLF